VNELIAEHIGKILTAIIAGLGVVGGLLVWLVKWFAERASKSDERTIEVLERTAKERAVEADKWRETLAAHTGTLQRLADAGTATSRTIDEVGRAMTAINTRLDYLAARAATGRSGQMGATRPEEKR